MTKLLHYKIVTKKFILAILFSFGLLLMDAQQVKIDSVYYDRSWGTINTLISGLSESNYDFKMELKSGKFVYKPKSERLTIHLGHRNDQKILEWDFRKDSINDINQILQAKALVSPMVKYTPIKNVALSILFPGMGGKQVRKSKAAWIKGIVSWGLVASGVYFYSNAIKQYNTYSSSHNESQIANNLNPYNTSIRNSLLCFSGAGAIWTIDLATIIAKNQRSKKRAKTINGDLFIPDKQNSIE